MEKLFLLFMPVLLMIVAIFCASFSDIIDTAVNGNKQVLSLENYNPKAIL